MEKAICDFSYQSQGVWEPSIPETEAKKEPSQKKGTLHKKFENCYPEQMVQKPQTAEGVRPRHQGDLSARQQFWLQ